MTHIHLNPDKAQESFSGDATKKNDEVKKSLSESLCDKRFFCLLVAITDCDYSHILWKLSTILTYFSVKVRKSLPSGMLVNQKLS